MSFSGKTVIVTGSSNGIGKAAVLDFAKEGANVVVHGVNEQRLEQVAKELEALNVPKSRFIVVRGPIEDPSTQDELISQSLKTFGQIDVLVNNAGLTHLTGAEDDDIENLDYVLEVNLKAQIKMFQKAIPHLIKTKGNVINVSTVGAVRFYHLRTPYCVSKAGLTHFTRGMANKYGGEGVRVNTVSPGATETGILTRTGMSQEVSDATFKSNEFKKQIPLGYVAKPSDISSAITFLASPAANYITGVDLPVDGGLIVFN